MNKLFTNARLIDPETQSDALGWLHVKDGTIAKSGTGTSPDGEAIDCGGKCLAPGIIDIGVKVNEPGERHKESYRPAIDTPEVLEFVTRRAAADSPVNVLPMSALTKDRSGQEMVEIGFMLDAGAAAFTDCDNVTADNRVASRCFTYARSLGALVIGHPQDPGLSRGATATSGKFASLLGLPAVSPMAERMGLDRDLALVEMTGVRYHADQITTERALRRLERAKTAGLPVTAGTSIHHLTLNEFDVGDYRTFFKVKPPLRSEIDRTALVGAVASGLVDIICSMHTPQDEESKRLPFEEAASGAVGLETLLPAALRLYHSGEVTLAQLFRAMALNPARLLGLNAGRLSPGAPADLVLFDPDAPFILNRETLRSKSKNTPFDGQRMEGKVLGTWVRGNCVFGE